MLPGRAPGSTGTGAASLPLAALSLLLLQLLGALVAIHRFHLATPAFERVLVLAALTFPAHDLLPLKWRPPFFLAISLAAFADVLGMRPMLYLLAAGLVTFAIASAPWRLAVRLPLLIGVGVVAALLRVRAIRFAPLDGVGFIWPVFGAMFMFRLALYVYDREVEPPSERTGWAQSLGYFFLLPNVCFPLFPVVDFKEFRRGWYARPPVEIYQRGLVLILIGAGHLLVYRLVRGYLFVDPAQVDTPLSLVRAITSSFLVYLRVSGDFHVIVGLLHLFGFHLPDANRWFLLSDGFVDFFRRTNVYWNRFMTKLVFYPSNAFLGRRGVRGEAALILSSFGVAVVTWLLHAYQAFWIRGRARLGATDTVFWLLIMTLLIVSLVRQSRAARRPTPPPWRRALGVALTFSTVCVLWSLWASDDLVEWGRMMVRPWR